MDSAKFQDANFIAALALHSHRRDLALSLKPSHRTRGLLWYYNERQRQQVKDIFQAAFSQGAARRAKSRMAEIIREGETATPARRLELLKEAEAIQKRLENIMAIGAAG